VLDPTRTRAASPARRRGARGPDAFAGLAPPEARVRRYGLAILAVAAAVGLRIAIAPLMEGSVFLVFFPAVVVTAWYGGLGPAVTASLLSVIAADYFFLPPGYSFTFLPVAQAFQLTFFLLATALVASTTARLRAARDLAEGTAGQLEALIASAADGIVVVDHDGVILRVNPAVERIFGYPAEELVGRNLAVLMPEPYRSEHDGYLERYRRTGEPRLMGTSRELRGRRRDGTTFPLELALSEATVGTETLYTGIVRDVSERKWAEARERLLAGVGRVVAASLTPEEALGDLAEALTKDFSDYCMIHLLDEAGRVRSAGAAHADPERRPHVERLAGMWTPRLPDVEEIRRIVRAGEPILVADIPPGLLERAGAVAEYGELLQALGPVSFMVLPLRARERVLGALSLTATVDSGRRYAEADLRVAEEVAERIALGLDTLHLLREARRSAAARDEMLAVVSHDLRTPLQAVLAAARVLREPGLDADARRRQLEGIERAGTMMRRLTSDLLDVARIEGAAFTLDAEPLPVAPFVDEVAARHRDAFEARGVRLRAAVSGDPPAVLADRWRLFQLFGNLLDNALKLSPPDSEVALEAEPLGDRVVFRVCDQGPGIPEEDLPRIFDRFFRREGGRAGAGLGLAIARGIADAHGGSIDVTSRPGAGATFQVALPAWAGEKPEAR
jgi:PAS domain S-box-containing protein